MKLKAQTPKKEKSIVAANGKATKVQKNVTPAKNAVSPTAQHKKAGAKQNKTPAKKTPPKKVIEEEEDDDESEEEVQGAMEEDDSGSDGDEENAEESENGAGLIEEEAEESENEDDDDEDQDDDDEEEEDESIVQKGSGKSKSVKAQPAESDEEEDDEDEDDDEDDDDDGEDEEEQQITKKPAKKAKKSAKAEANESEDDDDEAPEEAPIKKSDKSASKTTPIINFKTIPQGTPAENMIHIRNLPKLTEYNHSDIASIFSKYGKMTAIVLYPGKNVTTSLVAFTSPEEATAALEANKVAKVKGNVIEVAMKKDKSQANNFQNHCTVYVGNLSESTTSKDLKEYFKDCGDIKRVQVGENPVKRYAFIKFVEEEAADKALKLNLTKLDGNVIEVRPRGRVEIEKDEEHSITIGNQQGFETYDEEKLRKIFEKCGEIRSIENLCKTYVLAFVSFTDPKSVDKALELNGTKVDDLELNITRYSSCKTRNTIFIKNIADGTTEEHLKKILEKSGEVESVKINPKYNTAIVQFADQEGYCKSFLLDEYYISNKPIFIQPFSKKKVAITKRLRSINLKRLNGPKKFGGNPLGGVRKHGNPNFMKKPFHKRQGGDNEDNTPPFFRKGGPPGQNRPNFKNKPKGKPFFKRDNNQQQQGNQQSDQQQQQNKPPKRPKQKFGEKAAKRPKQEAAE